MSSRWLLRLAHFAIIAAFSLVANGVHAVTVSGPQKVVVLRVYFHDRTKTSRYTKTQVEGFFFRRSIRYGARIVPMEIFLSVQKSMMI
jgi:hypothetical protein